MERRIILDAQTIKAILAGKKNLLRIPIMDKARLRAMGKEVDVSAGNYRGYHPGDIIWVAENWFQTDDGKMLYEADDHTGIGRWRPSMVMLKKEARLFLLVKRVEIQKLQQATIQSILDEGLDVEAHKDSTRTMSRWKWHWDKKWGRKNCSWVRNPWVELIYFTMIKGDENAK